MSLGTDWKWVRIQNTANGMFSPISGRISPSLVFSRPIVWIW